MSLAAQAARGLKRDESGQFNPTGEIVVDNTAQSEDDQRIKLFRLRIQRTLNFAHYTKLYLPERRAQFKHDVYFEPATEEQLYEAVRDGLVPEKQLTAGQVIGWLVERGIEAVRVGR